MAVRLGSERLFDSGALRGRRVGVVCNPASVDSGFRHILDRLALRTGRHARRDLRAAARVPVRRAGQHDRDRPRDGRDAPRARSTRSTARRASRPPRCCGPRRARHRPAGRRRPHLHLHLHDGQLPARLRPPRRAGHRVRSAEPDRRRGRRRADARAGLRVVRRPVPDPDAPRHDDRRAGAAVQRALRPRRGPRGRSRWRAGRATMYFDADRPAAG